MNNQFKYHEPIKDKPLVSTRVIVAALVSIAVVLFVGSIVWKIANG